VEVQIAMKEGRTWLLVLDIHLSLKMYNLSVTMRM